MTPTSLFTGLVLLFAGPAAVVETVPLRNGAVFRGEIVEYGGTFLVMTPESLPDSRLTIPLEQITDAGRYELRRRRIESRSSAAHETLGDWAAARKLFEAATREYAAALLLRGEERPASLLEKRDDARARCRRQMLEKGSRLVSEGRFREALDFFRDLVRHHPACPAVPAVRERLEALNGFLSERAAKEEAVEDAGEEEPAGRLDELLAAASMARRDGDRKRKEGYLHCGDLARAEDDFLAALASYEKGREILDRGAALPEAADRKEEVSSIRTVVLARLVAVHLDIAHNYVVKGNLVRANRHAGLALAIDPNDPNALDLRAAIAFASERSWSRSR